MGLILESKLVQKLSPEKMFLSKKSPKLIFLDENLFWCRKFTLKVLFWLWRYANLQNIAILQLIFEQKWHFRTHQVRKSRTYLTDISICVVECDLRTKNMTKGNISQKT